MSYISYIVFVTFFFEKANGTWQHAVSEKTPVVLRQNVPPRRFATTAIAARAGSGDLASWSQRGSRGFQLEVLVGWLGFCSTLERDMVWLVGFKML